MTALPEIPAISTALFATIRVVVRDVLDGAGLAVLRGPVGIGKSFALRCVASELENDGADVILLTATGAVEGKTIEFCRAIHMREGVSAADGLDLAWAQLKGHPFRDGGRRVVLLVDEAQELKSPILAMLRGLWDYGEAARLGDATQPAFGLVLIGNDQFLANRSRKEKVDLLPLEDRITHNVRLPRPTRAEHAAFARALFPEDGEAGAKLRELVQAFGEDQGSLRAAAKAARQARLRAGKAGESVGPDHLAMAIRLMGGR